MNAVSVSCPLATLSRAWVFSVGRGSGMFPGAEAESLTSSPCVCTSHSGKVLNLLYLKGSKESVAIVGL